MASSSGGYLLTSEVNGWHIYEGTGSNIGKHYITDRSGGKKKGPFASRQEAITEAKKAAPMAENMSESPYVRACREHRDAQPDQTRRDNWQKFAEQRMADEPKKATPRQDRQARMMFKKPYDKCTDEEKKQADQALASAYQGWGK